MSEKFILNIDTVGKFVAFSKVNRKLTADDMVEFQDCILTVYKSATGFDVLDDNFLGIKNFILAHPESTLIVNLAFVNKGDRWHWSGLKPSPYKYFDFFYRGVRVDTIRGTTKARAKRIFDKYFEVKERIGGIKNGKNKSC